MYPINLRTPRASCSGSRPPTSTFPASRDNRVLINSMEVVFPAPLGPTSPVTVPSGMLISTSSSATVER